VVSLSPTFAGRDLMLWRLKSHISELSYWESPSASSKFTLFSLRTHQPKSELKLELRPGHVRFVPKADIIQLGKRAYSINLVRGSTCVLAPPIAHGTDDRAEIAALCGEDVLGPRGAHRIEAPLDDAIFFKRPQTFRQRIRGNAFQRVLQLLKAPWT